MYYDSMKQLIRLAGRQKKCIGDIVLAVEAEQEDESPSTIRGQMVISWEVMKLALERGITEDIRSVSGLSGGDAKLLFSREPKFLSSEVSNAVARALGVAEVNASMGRIVACPTAGSCGIVPAALLLAKEKLELDEAAIIKALFTAAGIGIVCSLNASISGAEGGCQAECGVAAAMAAGALTELAGGSPTMVGHAVALTLSNMLGLVCDPVAGLVEVPCVLRNAGALMQALLGAELALAGIKSRIPVDEVIGAMREVGEDLPESLRETSLGGLANTPTGVRLRRKLA
ncbi:MAG: L-serine ammonia-lyase, iron-sulfur-dependent, subunit alpha [Candidatus Hermodarchaeota archaeon]|nr:L-serine ammonia-lyase, iron-sulfur-dependent, subunit alpha [Candidatus Hermodarchaeota archaeon]